MGEIKRIIAATDMSRLASFAEARAAMLAHELGAESLDLLHIVDNLSLEALRQLARAPEDADHRLLESSRNQLTEIEKRLAERYGITITTTALNVGRTHTEILRYAKLLNAGLVVMGVHGGGFVRKLFVGSTVDKVLRTLACPVLVVKREPETPYQRVLVPVDFSEPSRLGMDIALTIAPRASITVLHAFEVPFEANFNFSDEQIQAYRAEQRAEKSEELKKFLSDFKPSAVPSPAVEFGPASTVIQEQIEVFEPDLIVIGKHGKSGWENMLLGSVTKQVMQYADCDVLVVGQGQQEEAPR